MSSQMQREMVIRSKQKALEHKRVLAVEFAKLALGSDEASGPGGLNELSEAEEKLLVELQEHRVQFAEGEARVQEVCDRAAAQARADIEDVKSDLFSMTAQIEEEQAADNAVLASKEAELAALEAATGADEPAAQVLSVRAEMALTRRGIEQRQAQQRADLAVKKEELATRTAHAEAIAAQTAAKEAAQLALLEARLNETREFMAQQQALKVKEVAKLQEELTALPENSDQSSLLAQRLRDFSERAEQLEQKRLAEVAHLERNIADSKQRAKHLAESKDAATLVADGAIKDLDEATAVQRVLLARDQARLPPSGVVRNLRPTAVRDNSVYAGARSSSSDTVGRQQQTAKNDALALALKMSREGDAGSREMQQTEDAMMMKIHEAATREAENMRQDVEHASANDDTASDPDKLNAQIKAMARAHRDTQQIIGDADMVTSKVADGNSAASAMSAQEKRAHATSSKADASMQQMLDAHTRAATLAADAEKKMESARTAKDAAAALSGGEAKQQEEEAAAMQAEADSFMADAQRAQGEVQNLVDEARVQVRAVALVTG
jgi:hypothetical protein